MLIENLVRRRVVRPRVVTKRHQRRPLWPALLLVLTGACARTPDAVTARIRIAEDSTALLLTPEVGSFKVTAAVTNEDSRTIYLGGCGPQAQRQIGTEWQTVWTGMCVGAPGMTAIQPGDSLKFPVAIVGFRQPNRVPAFDPRITTGTYRLLFGLAAAAGGTEPISVKWYPSTSFILVDTTTIR